MKKYLEDLKNELKNRNMNDEEIAEILKDHEEMINEAIDEGMSEADLAKKFGDPGKIADDIADLEGTPKSGPEPEPEPDAPDMDIAATFAVSGDEISVTVKLLAEDIQIKTSPSEKITVRYQGKGRLDAYRIVLENKELLIKRIKDQGINLFGSRKADMEFEISLPTTQKIRTLNVETISSDILVSGLTTMETAINATSGDVVVRNLVANTAKLSTVSGELNLNRGIVESLNLSQVSGDCTVENTIVEGEIRTNSVSGELKFDNTVCREVFLRTVSGDIRGTEFYPSSLTFSSVSGDVDIANKDLSKTIAVQKTHSVSGTVRINGKR